MRYGALGVLAFFIILVFASAAYAMPTVQHDVQVVNKGDQIMIHTQEGNVHVDIPGAKVTYDEENGTITIETPSGKVKAISPERVQAHIQTMLKQQLCQDNKDMNCDQLQQRIMEHLQLKECQVYDPNTHQMVQKYCYEAPVRVRAKFLGIFNVEFDEQIQCDAETGATCQVQKPWWAFLVTAVEPVTEPQ